MPKKLKILISFRKQFPKSLWRSQISSTHSQIPQALLLRWKNPQQMHSNCYERISLKCHKITFKVLLQNKETFAAHFIGFKSPWQFLDSFHPLDAVKDTLSIIVHAIHSFIKVDYFLFVHFTFTPFFHRIWTSSQKRKQIVQLIFISPNWWLFKLSTHCRRKLFAISSTPHNERGCKETWTRIYS